MPIPSAPLGKRVAHAGDREAEGQAKGKTKKKLKKKGKAKVKAKVTFKVTGGDPVTKTKKLKLVASR